jgi:hypothetical protein
MKCVKLILVFAFMSLFLSACGDSGGSHHASWESATLFADNAVGPQLAADGNGNLIVVWDQYDGIYSNRYNASKGWETPQKIGEVSAHGLPILHIAASRSGHAVVAWGEYDAENNESSLMAVRYIADSGWGLVENISRNAEFQDMAIDNSGNVYILTKQFGKDDFGIVLARSRQGNDWSYERVNDLVNYWIGTAKIALDGLGNGFIIWEQIGNGLYIRSVSRDGLGTHQQIASITDGDYRQRQISISLDNNGNAMALWGQVDSSNEIHTYACRYTLEDGWGVAEKIDKAQVVCRDQYLAVDSIGNFYAIWVQASGSDAYEIYSCEYTTAGGWQIPRRVGTGGVASNPKIAADAYGNLFAVWLQFDQGQRFNIYGKVVANRGQTGADWGPQQELTSSSYLIGEPLIGLCKRDKALVMWSQYDNETVDGSRKYWIYSSRFR